MATRKKAASKKATAGTAPRVKSFAAKQKVNIHVGDFGAGVVVGPSEAQEFDKGRTFYDVKVGDPARVERFQDKVLSAL